jgi:hypothetical protein
MGVEVQNMAKKDPKESPKKTISQAALEFGRAQAAERVAKEDLDKAQKAYEVAQKNADLASEALLKLAGETV